MQAIAIKPQNKELNANILAIALCGLVMILYPVLCLPIALLLPLFACPLWETKYQWVSIVAIFLAPLVSYLKGMQPFYSVSLIVIVALPILATHMLKSDKKAISSLAFLYYIIAYAAGLLFVIACGSDVLGGSIGKGLADVITAKVKASPDRSEILFQLASNGFVSMPAGYQKATMLTFMIDLRLINQLLMSLHLTIELLITNALPELYVQVCIICGVFTALRVQKLHHSYLLVGEAVEKGGAERQVKISISPGFSRLQITRKTNRIVMCIGLASLLLMSSQSGTVGMYIQLLCIAIFRCIYQLLGAAVAVDVLSARNSERKAFYGILVSVVYVLVPMILYILGLFEPIFHFREKLLSKKEEE